MVERPTAVDEFVEGILQFPGVEEAKGERFGERSFRVGGREFLHIHGSALHILLPREAKAEALARGRAQQHPFAPRSGMVAVYLRSRATLPDALALARTAYEFVASLGRRRGS